MVVKYSDTFEKGLSVLKVIFNKTENMFDRLSHRKGVKLFLFLVAIVFCFTSIFILNILTPLISDDFAYMFIYGQDTARITSISDIVQSQINHYEMWGGRSVVHFIAQWLLLLPPFTADLLNSIVFFIYIFLIYYHIKGTDKDSISLFLLIFFAVWFVQPVLGDTVFWITGAANYLWGTTLILLFLLPYRFYKGEKINISLHIAAALFMFLFGVIAGWTNENTAGAMLLITVLFFVYYRSKGWTIPLWSIIGFVGALIGFLVMILAPGNLQRAGESASLTPFLFAFRFYISTSMFAKYCALFSLAFLILLILYYSFPKGEKNDVLKLTSVFFIAALAAVYAMILSPTFPRRALFGVITFMIIAAGIVYYNLDFKYKFIRQIRMVILAVSLFGFMFTFNTAVTEIGTFRKISEQRKILIEEAVKNGEPSCEFDSYSGGIYIHGEDPFTEQLMSRYYNIKIRLMNVD